MSKEKKLDSNQLKKCPECAEDIQENAKVCKHCGKKQKKEADKKFKIIMGIFWIAVFIMIVSSCSGGGSSVDTSQKTGATDTEAHIIAQGYVKTILKAPSTADFPMYDYNFFELGNSKYKIISYVDSQNSFGAQVRSDYSVILSYNSGEWANINNWTLHELIFDNEIMYEEPQEDLEQVSGYKPTQLERDINTAMKNKWHELVEKSDTLVTDEDVANILATQYNKTIEEMLEIRQRVSDYDLGL